MSDDVTPEKQFKVSSTDGTIIVVSEKTIRKCTNLVKPLEEFRDNEVIPIDNVEPSTLSLVLKWCEHHKNEPNIDYNDMSDVSSDMKIPEYDQRLMDITNDELFKLAWAASNLKIKGLRDVTSKKIAEKFKGKTPEQMRQTLGIPKNLDEMNAQLDLLVAAQGRIELQPAQPAPANQGAANQGQ